MITYRGKTFERNESGSSRSEVHTGSFEEMKQLLDSLLIGSSEDRGEHISRAVMSQKDGDIWQCEIAWFDPDNGLGSYSNAPSTAYGEKSAQLACGLVSVPLESLENYRKCWNHYLLAANGESVVPSWWDKAGYDTVLSADQGKKYRWVKYALECPDSRDEQGRVWTILKYPTKPGVTHVALATYQVTESVRCKTAAGCGKYVCSRLNRIGAPSACFSITGGSWKCDNASVSYTGKYWLATLTYTRSCNASGWDPDLYSRVSSRKKEM